VCILEKGDSIVAAMPYYETRKFGLKLIAMPPITQSLGPWIRPIQAKYSRSIGVENSLIVELYDQLPKYDHLVTNWHYFRTNWLGLYWKGFKQTTRYTYVLEDLLENENYLENFSSSYRNKINKASKIVTVKTDLPIEEFYLINMLTFERQKIEMPYSMDFLLEHDEALSKNNCRRIFYAEDEKGNIHSSLYLTWDHMSAYVHLVGEDPQFRNSGAGILLVSEAIKFTRNELKLDVFDFEGSMIQSVEQVRRGCGGRQKPYFSISKTNSILFKIIQFIRDI
jgi:hypothetical protein